MTSSFLKILKSRRKTQNITQILMDFKNSSKLIVKKFHILFFENITNDIFRYF